MTLQARLVPPTNEEGASDFKGSEASVSTKLQKTANLKNKAYRDAFVASQISVGLPFQIRALREQRGWKQSFLAGKADMLQPRISAMESPGASKFNLETLRRLASAFDVALVVRFAPFGELLDWSEHFSPDTFRLPSFEDDPAFKESAHKPEKIAAAIAPTSYPALNPYLIEPGVSLGDAYRGALATYTGPWFSGPDIRFMQTEASRELSDEFMQPSNPVAASVVDPYFDLPIPPPKDRKFTVIPGGKNRPRKRRRLKARQAA